MDIKLTQRVLLAHRQLQGRATDAAPSDLRRTCLPPICDCFTDFHD